jgi:hypothetical protein
VHDTRRKLRTGLRLGLLVALATAATGLAALPAQAIPTLPPETPGQLTVITFVDGNDVPVGQRWYGCPGVPLDSWGVTSDEEHITWRSCQDSLPWKPTH